MRQMDRKVVSSSPAAGDFVLVAEDQSEGWNCQPLKYMLALSSGEEHAVFAKM
jgi:hypothetical protein